MGAVSPNGIGRDAYWKNTSSGVSGTGPITLFDASKLSCKVAAEVKDFDFDRYISKKDRDRVQRAVPMAFFATDEAAQDAGINLEGLTASERENIGVGTDFSASGSDLLRRQEPRRPENRGSVGHVFAKLSFLEPTNTEVQQAYVEAVVLALNEENVRRLDVAVDDSLLRRNIQRGGDLFHDRERLYEREAPDPSQPGREILAAQQLHDDVLDSGPARAEVEHTCDTLTGQSGDSLYLLPKTREWPWLFGEVRMQNLDGHAHVIEKTFSLVNVPHSSLADTSKEPIFAVDDFVEAGLARSGGRRRRAAVAFADGPRQVTAEPSGCSVS